MKYFNLVGIFLLLTFSCNSQHQENKTVEKIRKHTKALELNKKYVLNKLFLGSFESSKMELLQEKPVQRKTMIYVCENKACQLPTTNIMKAQKLMK
tara:strand:- start:243 stop:530 length:288 start_codon:yes stop_codon:yes gene_type:complete